MRRRGRTARRRTRDQLRSLLVVEEIGDLESYDPSVVIWSPGLPLRPGPWASVSLHAADPARLGVLLTCLPRTGRSADITCRVAAGFSGPLDVRLDPSLPAVTEMSVRIGERGYAVIQLKLAGPAGARRVLLSLGAALRAGSVDTKWPILRLPHREVTHAAPLDVVPPEDAGTAEDVWLDPTGETPVSDEITGRPPVVVHRQADLSWVDLSERGVPRHVPGPVTMGVVDDRVFNPRGFRSADADHPMRLTADTSGALVLTCNESTRLAAHLAANAAALRRVSWVDLDWRGGRGPVEYARAVAALAMLGVPLISTSQIPEWASTLLAPGLTQFLPRERPDPENLESWREVVSVQQRRVAHAGHAPPALRRAWARLAGLPIHRPKVSVLLATRRPQCVAHACAQVAAQRNVDLELVLALHGIPSPHIELEGVEKVEVALPPETPFGAVLNEAAGRASGDWLLKMDDDDWYGPEFVSDLMLARHYSSADVTGTPPEYWYLEATHQTLYQPWSSEAFVDFVAGGTLLVDRRTFVDAGGFRPVRRHVDAAFLKGVREGGGRVYRTHGLGYQLRRSAQGHTWKVDDRALIADQRTRWVRDGFVAAPLLDGAPGLPFSS